MERSGRALTFILAGPKAFHRQGTHMAFVQFKLPIIAQNCVPLVNKKFVEQDECLISKKRSRDPRGGYMAKPTPPCRPLSRDSSEIQVIKNRKYLESNIVSPRT